MSNTASTTPRTRTGCQNCRLRHLKCDEQRPACTRCAKTGIECVRGYNIRFRHGANPSVANVKGSGLSKSEYDFAKNQTWLSTTNRNLTFLDETQELISIYDRDSDPENATNTPLHWTGSAYSAPINVQHDQIQVGSPSRTRPIPSRLGSTGGSSVGDLTSPTKRRRLTFSSSYQGSMGESPGQYQHSPAASWHMPSQSGLSSTPVDSNVHDPTLDPTFATLEPTVSNTSQLGPSFTAVSENLSRVYLDAPLWPLQDKEEARLMRYFVEHLAQSFDLTDPVNHFQNVVPQRAALCPTLLNAVFAASARHLSRISDYDPLVSNRYHQECLKHLIPMLDDTASILDENLLASTVILRYLEEIEVPLSGALHYADGESHLLGTHVFITAQERSTVTGGLRQAAFWVGLRQEIYVAFVNQRSIIPALEHCNIDRSFEATDDHTWANRIVVHCADVIRYCFGDLDHTHAAYTHLVDYSSDWYNYKPPSFAPIYYRDPEGSSIFPEIWLLGDEIVTALQHWHLARILLSAHNPRVPRLGPGRAQALRTMDEEIKHDVKMLCGMAESNSKSPPNYVTAAMAITMAGDKFTEQHEQEALLNVLAKTESDHAWPTGVAQGNLREAWGWDSA